MTGPRQLSRRDLYRIRDLARRCGKEATVTVRRWRTSARRHGIPLADYKKDLRFNDEWLTIDGDGVFDRYEGGEAVFLDLVEAVGFDTILHSNKANGGGY